MQALASLSGTFLDNDTCNLLDRLDCRCYLSPKVVARYSSLFPQQLQGNGNTAWHHLLLVNLLLPSIHVFLIPWSFSKFILG